MVQESLGFDYTIFKLANGDILNIAKIEEMSVYFVYRYLLIQNWDSDCESKYNKLIFDK